MLYVYALLETFPEASIRGVAGEPLRAVAVGGLEVAIGEISAPPRTDTESIRAHDEVARALAGGVDAVLPVRFGTLFAGEAELADAFGVRAGELGEALSRVRGREQMNLRVFGTGANANADADADADGAAAAGPGTRWLAARARAQAAKRAIPELAGLRAALAGFVAEERAERHDRPPLLASVHHLVARGAARAYLAALEHALAEGALAPGLHVRASGPFPCWAFGPEAP